MRTNRLGILLSGRGSNFQAIARQIASGALNAKIAIAISNHADAAGLGIARELGIPAVCAPSKDDAGLVRILQDHGVDLVCLAGYLRMLSPAFVQAFPLRILNIHPSLLPAFPGLDAQAQALRHGVKVTGCTVHFVDESMDTGPIVLQSAVDILDEDTESTLSARILQREHQIYSRAIQLVLRGRFRIEGRRVLAGQQ